MQAGGHETVRLFIMGASEGNTTVKWLIVIGSGSLISALPRPEGVTRPSWTLLAIFIATIVGSVIQPLRGSAMVLLGVIATGRLRRS
jgi:di/tricarboxylate transporter